MTDEMFPHTGSKTIVKLRGPSSQTLSLIASADPTNPHRPIASRQMIQWLPEDREAMEVEIRAVYAAVPRQLPGPPPVPLPIPAVWWTAEFGHGKATYRRPDHAFPSGAIAGLPAQDYLMPVRGLYLRGSFRELKLTFYLGNTLEPAPFDTGELVPSAKIIVSFQPVLSSVAPVWPRQQFAWFVGAGPTAMGIVLWPMEAHEFRVRQLGNSLPFALGSCFVQFLGINGAVIGAADANALQDWTPIPIGAYSYVVTAANPQVDYR
jgi:hypothetical protein